MKILITEPEYFPRELMKPLENLGRVVAKRMSYNELMEEIKDTDALIVRVETKVDKKILDNAERLKIIASMTTGLDHIDMKQAEMHGIKIVSLLGYATTATAEYTMTMILSLFRNLPAAVDHAKKEKWERHKFLGTELSGKTIGIIGFGRIGSNVGRYAKAFGMNVLFYDPHLDVSIQRDPEAKQASSLDSLLEQSDVVTIHTFLSSETKKMIGKGQLEKMKKNAVIVNVSRGMVLDESDLIDALESKTIAGAALDVFEEEPLPASSRLLRYARENDNLIITPHIAGSTRESVETAASFVVDQILKEFS